MAHACGEALGSEQEMLNDRSNWGIADECGEALRSEQERINVRAHRTWLMHVEKHCHESRRC